jgi:hypothetical protein
VLSGGLQPRVTPDAANRSMSPSNTDPSSSVKLSPAPGGNDNARFKNAAICPRVTGSSGQNNSVPHPVVMPASTSASM